MWGNTKTYKIVYYDHNVKSGDTRRSTFVEIPYSETLKSEMLLEVFLELTVELTLERSTTVYYIKKAYSRE
jgi:hypothetical protein